MFNFIKNIISKISNSYVPTNNYKYHNHKRIYVYPEISDDNIRNRELVKNILYSNIEFSCSKILHDYFIYNTGVGIDKYLRYFDLYDRYFSKYRGKDINLLEVGVQNGGSTKMWKYYFTYNLPNVNVNIYGVDIDARCKDIEEEGIKIFIGSQTDREFWRKLKNEIPKIDILIDDGGHKMDQQIITLEEMYDHIKDNGLYWCEDTSTSYWKSHGGGYKNNNTYIEYTKNIIDYLNAYYALKDDDLTTNIYTDTAYSICYHENVVVIEKRIRNKIFNTYPMAFIGNSIR
ncbi:class I SAM-dependent methyltransferase [Brachyspira pilosicoli]|uniref:class I SAM-dependent methyltransferase n=1 Tax=Brachyspira pilosicoli TaxID=52584 RepID=UPI0025437EF1|nr:class I SAM-dependent methyltransferase [Brachyspira pilosicoli]WIH87731.1 class I SAM-dependent methyltransferase [Brachyspira pilosicoli]